MGIKKSNFIRQLLNRKELPFILLCLLVFGCASASQNRKLEDRITQLEETLSKKNEQINNLQESLNERDNLLREKNLKIEEMGKKLESLGVFEEK